MIIASPFSVRRFIFSIRLRALDLIYIFPVHGGGGIAFGPSTSLYKLISTLLKPKTIVSVELPCHGKNRSSHVAEPQDALEHACSELAPKVRAPAPESTLPKLYGI
jgi:hypothetical protein